MEFSHGLTKIHQHDFVVFILQGELELFVDILPLADGAPGPPVNVTPRKAKL